FVPGTGTAGTEGLEDTVSLNNAVRQIVDSRRILMMRSPQTGTMAEQAWILLSSAVHFKTPRQKEMTNRQLTRIALKQCGDLAMRSFGQKLGLAVGICTFGAAARVMAQSPGLLAQVEEPEQQSFLIWMLESLGLFG